MVSYSVKLKGNNQRTRANGRVPLYLLVIINRESYPVSLGLTWPAHLVDNKAGQILSAGKRDTDYNDYQLIISNELQKINEIFKIYRIQDRILTKALFIDELQNIDRRKDFIAYMIYKINQRYKEKEISSKTKQNHMSTLHRFVLMQKSIPFYAVDAKLLKKFTRFLAAKYENEESTIWGRIKDLKTYLNYAQAEGIAVNMDYENFSNPVPASRIIYLEEFQINNLMKLYNSRTLEPTAQEVLRASLFSCFTSLRISDVQRAEWGWVQMSNEMRFLPWKTRRFKREVVIPLSSIAKSFIAKRVGKFFNLPTDQEINRSLKEIAKYANINLNLTFNVLRHTFATHYYRQTKDVVSLQKIMGHSKIQTTMVYVHINEQDKKTGMELMEASFMKNAQFLKHVI
jgi:integrase/recombinase XerD